jgi:hypothetical protein
MDLQAIEEKIISIIRKIKPLLIVKNGFLILNKVYKFLTSI